MAHWDPDELTDPIGWQLKDPKDLAFAQIAQGSRVDGATLPSGLKVPVTPGMKWMIEGQSIRCIEEAND